jgi:hypothetical protein
MAAADFVWPMPGEAFWRALGTRDPAESAATPVYRRQLRFYDADPPAFLIAIDAGETGQDDGDRVAYLVQAGAELMPLTGGSDVIHALNERYGGPREGFILDYVEFFCSFVAGDEGPFLVPRDDDERDEIAGRDDFGQTVSRARERLVLGEEAAAARQGEPDGATLPATLASLPDDQVAGARAAAEKAGWSDVAAATFARAHVIYGSAVFAATFAVARDGTIEMLDDDPLAPLQTATRHRFVEEAGSSWLVREWGGRSRERVNARDFIARVFARREDDAIDGCTTLRHLEVIGDVVFPACRPLPWLHCEGVDFRGSVVLDDCHALDRVALEACRIAGSFSAQRATFDKSLVLRRCQVLALVGDSGRLATREQDRFGGRDFGGPVAVALDSAKVEVDLDLERTSCHATLRGRRVRVGGSASLAGVRVLPAVVPMKARPTPATDAAEAGPQHRFAASASPVQLDLTDAEFGGSVSLNCALDHAAIVQWKSFAPYCHRPVVAGALLLEGVRIRGSLWIRGLGVLGLSATRRGPDHFAYCSLRLARIDGGLQNYESLQRPFPPTRILGELDLTCAHIGSYAHFDGFFIAGDLELGALTAQSVSMSAEYQASGPVSDGDYGGAEPWFDYTAGRPDAVAGSWRTCYVGGNVGLNNARISGSMFVRGGWIDGTLHARHGACMGSLLIVSLGNVADARRPGDSRQTLERHGSRFGSIEIETATFTGSVAVLDSGVAKHLSIDNSRIAGDLDFYGNATLARECANYLTGPGSTVADFLEREFGLSPPTTRVGSEDTTGRGSLEVKGSTVGGYVDLRNLKVRDDLRLEDTTIAGDLATARGRVLRGAAEGMFKAAEGGQRAVTPVVHLEGCRAAVFDVHGECIDDVVEPDPAENQSELAIRTECRRFVFDSLHCRGDARLWRLRASQSVSGRHAEFGGSLSFCVLGSGVAPLPVRSDGSGKRSVNLERADFGQLTIVEPFPPNVQLRGIRVGQWSPRSRRDAEQQDPEDAAINWPERAELMLKVLERMPDKDFEPAVYLDVEQYFRASGQDELADGIYCALRDRQAMLEEAEAGCERALWLWLALLALPLTGFVAAFAGIPPAARWLDLTPDAPTVLGLLAGFIGPWLLAFRLPPRPAPGAPGRRPRAAAVHGSVLRLAAVVVGVAALFLSEFLQAFLVIAALAFWAHAVALLPAAAIFERMRGLVVGRLMLRLGTAWGTAAHRLVLAWLLLLLFPLAIVLHEPRNLEPTMMARGALKYPDTATPDPATWRWSPGEAPPTWVWMAIESTVPIITINAEDKWEASDRPPAVLACDATVQAAGGCRDFVVPFGTSPKQIESFLRLIGWVFWPLAAAGFAASFIHRRQATK